MAEPEWKQGIIVKIPKKGNIADCNNWRGITLLSIPGKIFTLRNIIEQSAEFQRPLQINFIDFKKAFDSVHRESLWKIVRAYDIPQRFLDTLRNIYLDSSCCVKIDTGNTEFFHIVTGVRQDCIISPFLFLLVIDFVMRETMNGSDFGIQWNNMSRFTDLDFADDIVLLANTEENLQKMTTALETTASNVGLRINSEKTNTFRRVLSHILIVQR
ncbi:unnamed protein product [Adineta ricciae]|uniref:Reverse transcriptase domain-containing protein n=1 Tax=Adineta ricciae TaxID=249248 RepID=A0A815L5X2_ADIRI|nr:unnamed protein product [Adineta ricciae]CAF1445241.1 unnamed protein product [Adineta ricciae]